jgi:hypothetical protein
MATYFIKAVAGILVILHSSLFRFFNTCIALIIYEFCIVRRLQRLKIFSSGIVYEQTVVQ